MTLSELALVTLNLATEAALAGEVPVAAAIFRSSGGAMERPGEILALERNRIVERRDPTAHAEMLALREAARRLDSERLQGVAMLTTLEPCLMCGAALQLARVERVYALAAVTTWPGLGDLQRELPPRNHRCELLRLHGFGEESSELLRSFFRERRNSLRF